jgi:hypothetical protein
VPDVLSEMRRRSLEAEAEAEAERSRHRAAEAGQEASRSATQAHESAESTGAGESHSGERASEQSGAKDLPEVITSYGTGAAEAVSEGATNLSEGAKALVVDWAKVQTLSDAPAAPAVRPSALFTEPLSVGEKVLSFAVRWMGPLMDVASYISTIYDEYKIMSANAVPIGRDRAMLEILHNGGTPIAVEGFPLVFDKTNKVLYEFQIGVWSGHPVGELTKVTDLQYDVGAQVFYSERYALYKDGSEKWHLAVAQQNVGDVRPYTPQ